MAQKATQTTLQPVVNAPQSEEAGSGSSRSATSLFALATSRSGQDVQNKVAFMGDIRQRLAQVADEAKAHGEQAAETESLADASATRLFKARVAGMISQDELTGLLGDIFGYKPKADGTPGKTPAGTGDAIRKRIVRAVQGWDFVNGGDGGRFYETMDADEVAPVISAIGRTKLNEKGETVEDGISLWSAYKQLGDIKSQGTVRLPFAFDAKKIAGLVDSLSEAGARDKLLSNQPLLKAYGALMDQLTIIDQVDASEVETVRSKLGLAEPEANENDGEEEVAA